MESSGELAKLKVTDIKKFVESNNSNLATALLLKDHYTQFIESRNKPRTQIIYLETYKKIEKFADLSKLTFEDINYKWLKDFESFLLETNSINIVSIYLSNLRALFNNTIDENIISQNLYPFRKFKIKNEPTK